MQLRTVAICQVDYLEDFVSDLFLSQSANMPSVKIGHKLPQGTFTYIPYSPELDDKVSYYVFKNVNTRTCVISLLAEFVSDH